VLRSVACYDTQHWGWGYAWLHTSNARPYEQTDEVMLECWKRHCTVHAAGLSMCPCDLAVAQLFPSGNNE
jgi:hypothetical protein